MAITRNCASCGKANRIPAQTSLRHWTMRRLQEPSASDRRARRGQPRGLRRRCPRQQSSRAGGFLGGMVWSVPDGRATRGPSRSRLRRPSHRAEGRHREISGTGIAVQRARNPELRGICRRWPTVPAGWSGGREHNEELARNRRVKSSVKAVPSVKIPAQAELERAPSFTSSVDAVAEITDFSRSLG